MEISCGQVKLDNCLRLEKTMGLSCGKLIIFSVFSRSFACNFLEVPVKV